MWNTVARGILIEEANFEDESNYSSNNDLWEDGLDLGSDGDEGEDDEQDGADDEQDGEDEEYDGEDDEQDGEDDEQDGEDDNQDGDDEEVVDSGLQSRLGPKDGHSAQLRESLGPDFSETELVLPGFDVLGP